MTHAGGTAVRRYAYLHARTAGLSKRLLSQSRLQELTEENFDGVSSALSAAGLLREESSEAPLPGSLEQQATKRLAQETLHLLRGVTGYERAGKVQALCGESGSVTLIGSVSPPGGDFSEPVTGYTKDFVPVFWALSKELSDARHYPAISWTESFSGNVEKAAQWWAQEVDERWAEHRRQALVLLATAEELERIVGLVGPEALSGVQRWSLSCAVLLKEAVLQQMPCTRKTVSPRHGNNSCFWTLCWRSTSAARRNWNRKSRSNGSWRWIF